MMLLPLAHELNLDLSVTIGAVVSAGAFGSHACFYGDATVLSSISSGCDKIEHAITQLPYAVIAVAVAAVIYFALGVVLS